MFEKTLAMINARRQEVFDSVKGLDRINSFQVHLKEEREVLVAELNELDFAKYTLRFVEKSDMFKHVRQSLKVGFEPVGDDDENN